MSEANTRIAMELLRKVEALPSQGNAFIIADELERAEKRGKEEAAGICDALADREDAMAIYAGSDDLTPIYRRGERVAQACAAAIRGS